jgi:hypothetical protein
VVQVAIPAILAAMAATAVDAGIAAHSVACLRYSWAAGAATVAANTTGATGMAMHTSHVIAVETIPAADIRTAIAADTTTAMSPITAAANVTIATAAATAMSLKMVSLYLMEE